MVGEKDANYIQCTHEFIPSLSLSLLLPPPVLATLALLLSLLTLPLTFSRIQPPHFPSLSFHVNSDFRLPEDSRNFSRSRPEPLSTLVRLSMISSNSCLPSSHLTPGQDDWSSDYSGGVSPSSAYIVDSPASDLSSPALVSPRSNSAFKRPPSTEPSMSFVDFGNQNSSARSPNTPALPDPAQFPDPYPYRPPHWHVGPSTPALSSADSSTASTRSSAYTSSGRSVEYNHIHVALGDDEPSVGVGITTDDVVQLLANDASMASSSASPIQGRAPVDQTRWSDLYTTSSRSRSSSVGRVEPVQDNIARVLRGTPSFDLEWQPADERDEVDLESDEDSDEDELDEEDEEEEDAEEEEEEPTSAMIMAEQGRGVIVRGDNTPVMRIQVKPGLFSFCVLTSSSVYEAPRFFE